MGSAHASHHHHHHGGGDSHAADDVMMELLDLDAVVVHAFWDEVLTWVRRATGSASPRRIVDLGGGTGVGSIALANVFPDAEIVAVDSSARMLERLRARRRTPVLTDGSVP